MAILNLAFILSLLKLAAAQFYEFHEYNLERISDCSRIMAHFGRQLHQDVSKQKGCIINKRFTNYQLSRILAGVGIEADKLLQKPQPFKQRLYKRGILDFIWNKRDNEPMEKKPTLTTVDGLFLISPICNKEFESFQKGIADYVQHINENSKSLLVRVVGMFCVDKQCYVAYLSPFNTNSVSQHLVMELSPYPSQSDPFKRQGHSPFGAEDWSTLTKGAALCLSSYDEKRFKEVYEIDRKFLRENNYRDYELMIAVNGDVSKYMDHPYNSFFSINNEGGPESVSISITHFFRRSKKNDNVIAYSDNFDMYRKTKVIYGDNEGRGEKKKKSKESKRMGFLMRRINSFLGNHHSFK